MRRCDEAALRGVPLRARDVHLRARPAHRTPATCAAHRSSNDAAGNWLACEAWSRPCKSLTAASTL
eukprot:1014152-Pleurochrysis_carterae.AAC.1